MAVGMMWYNGDKTKDMVGRSYFSSRGFACMPRTPPTEFRAGESNVVWAAAHNQFFAIVAMLQQPATEVLVQKVDLPRPTQQEIEQKPGVIREPEGYVTAITYPGQTIAPGDFVEKNIHLYAGPKEYRTLVRIATEFHNDLDRIMGFGWLAFLPSRCCSE